MPGSWIHRALYRYGCGLEMGLIIAIVRHVLHSAMVPFTEAFAKVFASFPIDGWVLVHFMIIGIGMAMLAEIVARSFNALVKSALLCIAIIGGWLIPTVMVLRKGRAGEGLRFMGTGFESAG
jgi:hypothetical protein